jgi:rhodanese-related sulfurtransferase
VVAVGATLCADLVWYSLARWRGTRTLALIARFSATARGSVQRGQSLFRDHEGAFRLGARFLPELSPIAAGGPRTPGGPGSHRGRVASRPPSHARCSCLAPPVCELRALLEASRPITILDVRSSEDVKAAPYTLPGARWIRPDELSRHCRGIPRTAEVVVYGGSRQARTAWAALYARAALHLRRAGVRGVRPLVGGLQAGAGAGTRSTR